ncbi:MAG: kelch repeat-containing protein [Candidatus Promineifilaceae bacterium]|jgi:DNA-binding CsgD family transcriptional regulator/N-acetylneuraminic acid mutarotase
MAESGEPLSNRELDVLRCLVQGATNKDIASDLIISENTVKVHLRNIYTKLDVSSRTEAATAAMQQGYITLPSQVDLPTESAQNFDEIAETVSDSVTTMAVPATTLEETAIDDVFVETSNKSQGRLPKLALLGILILLALAAAFYLSQRFSTPEEIVATDELFSEVPIGNTHWLESKPMPEPRADMAVASVGLDLYQIGGDTADGVDGTVQVFNSVDHVWQTRAEKPTAVADASAAELYGEIYVAGGRTADGQPTSTVEAYSPTQDAWRPVASLPHPVTGALTLSDGAFLYLIGGYDGQSYLDESYVYNPAEDTWRPLPALPQPSAYASGGAITGKLIVVGGEDEGGILGACHLFDPAESSWSACPDMLQPRKNAGSAVLLNKLYVIGGTAGNGELTYSEMYDPVSETWQVINTPMLAESPDWAQVGVGQIETRIFALGGRKGEQLLDTNYIFAPLVYQTYIPSASSGDN